MKNLIKHPAVVSSVVILVAIAVGAYSYFSLTTHPHYDVVSVTTGDVVQQVAFTGQVKAAQNVELSFEQSGTVAGVYHKVGDVVAQGDILASLNTEDARADVAAAKASLESVKAQASIGLTQQDNAQTTVVNAEKAIVDSIQSAYIGADDAVRTQASQFFTNPTSANPQLTFIVPDQQLVTNLQNSRVSLELALNIWNSERSTLIANDEISIASGHAKKYLTDVTSFLDNCIIALNKAIPDQSVSAAMINNWKMAMTASRSQVTGALSAVTSAETQLSNAQSALTVAAQQIASGSAETSLTQSRIDQAQAVLDKARAVLNKTAIYAPFAGVVSRMDAKVGQAVNPAMAMVSAPPIALISQGTYQITGLVSEADIAKLKLQNQATVTLDAYGPGVPFIATIVRVDPAATIVNGVSSYVVVLQFTQPDPRIKSGMTANVHVTADSKQGVIVVPSSALIRQGTTTMVLVAGNNQNQPENRIVTTGIVGSDGMVEIISGLQAGEQIISLTSQR